MKKGAAKYDDIKIENVGPKDNSCGITSVILGIVSIGSSAIFAIALGVIAIAFAIRQKRAFPNKWSRAGLILGIIGVILGLFVLAVSLWLESSGASLSSLALPTYP